MNETIYKKKGVEEESKDRGEWRVKSRAEENRADFEPNWTESINFSLLINVFIKNQL